MGNIIIWQYIIAIIAICAISYTVHNSIEKIELKKHKKKQVRRYLTATLIAILPVAIAQIPLYSPAVIFNAVTAFLWAFTAPATMQLSKKNGTAAHRTLCMDIACGITLFGWLNAIQLLLSFTTGIANQAATLLFALLTFAITLIVVIQWGYYIIYGTQVEQSSMMVTLNSHYNEVCELFKSFPIYKAILIPVAIIALLACDIWGSSLAPAGRSFSITEVAILVAYISATTLYLFRKERGLFKRSYIIEIYLEIKDYKKRNLGYRSGMKERLQSLKVKAQHDEGPAPHTFILVIGESASRDYMSAYVDMEYDTTPWMCEQKKDTAHNIIFSNAYSCHHQTVPTLERALTERNQYNDKEFYESTSIIDIARALGYTTHWYSNQGYLGSSETSITLVANTSDTAKWTKQTVSKGRYDSALLEFLDEVDPTKNNFVVLHLKGNHANYIYRYPAEATQWGEPGVENLMLNYYNSLHYTDSILKEIYDYGREKLNMQAMLYFSDHGCEPSERRKSYFTGFGPLRIPMSIHLTDSYISRHKERFEAFKANKDKYFTNDLAYEMVCAMFDIESNHFDTSNSIGHSEYKYTREMLKTNCGAVPLTDEDKQ